MQAMVIEGGTPLEGTVRISGAKNAALPLIAAAVLTEEECVLRGVPQLTDVLFMLKILERLGVETAFEGDVVRIRAERVSGCVPYDYVRKMRGSICLLGPLLARLQEARVSMPGGCVIGPRPVDLHIKGMRALGARIELEGGYIHAKAPAGLHGTRIYLAGKAGPTVLGTANVMMAATLSRGETIILNAACEPEIVDLARFLNRMGARIEGAGSPTIRIEGVDRLHGAEHTIIPDRIEAATYAIAAAATGGTVRIEHARIDHLDAVIDRLSQTGVEVQPLSSDAFQVKGQPPFEAIDVTTAPYPGFPTDVQAQICALLTQAKGVSVVTERIFEARFMHVSELARMGASIRVEGPHAIIHGPTPLIGAPVMASDLRASAALVIAGLMAKGKTLVRRIYHLDRGYEQLDQKLRRLGAKIYRINE